MTALRTLRLWPRTLFARLMVILLVGLALAQRSEERRVGKECRL